MSPLEHSDSPYRLLLNLIFSFFCSVQVNNSQISSKVFDMTLLFLVSALWPAYTLFSIKNSLNLVTGLFPENELFSPLDWWFLTLNGFLSSNTKNRFYHVKYSFILFTTRHSINLKEL